MSRARHRKKGEAMTLEVVDPQENLGVLAAAVALQESGILVRGMTVTDLSTGYAVTGEMPEDRDPFIAEEDAPRFRGSAVGLAQLEMLRELVHDVVEQRRENPEWAQLDTPIPRKAFPWGVGLPEPDVVVAGGNAEVIADYLRCVGVRARTVDADRALWIAGDLAEVEHELAEVEQANAESRAPRGRLRWPAVESWPRLSLPALRLPSSSWKFAAGAAAIAVFAVGGIFAASAVLHTDAVEDSPSSSTTTPLASPAAEPTKPMDVGGEGVGPKEEHSPRKPWPEHHIAGEQMRTASVERASIPVRMDLPGWRRAGATPAREEFHSGDEDMRVLVSATLTPLKTQEELDGAVLKAVENTDGVRVAGRAPVSYEESYPDSTTIWHVRLVEGHQVSIGCQFRQITGARLKVCEEAASTARPDLPSAPRA